jgi:undecaprenyl-diphosphatase
MHSFFSFGILGLVEGLTEFVPVSSSGHLIVAHQILSATGADALSIDAILQLAAVVALVAYFWKDLISLLYTLLYLVTGRPVKPEDRRLLFALIVGTVPGVILGLFLEKTMDTIFRNTHLVAYALIAGSVVMAYAERSTTAHSMPRGLNTVGLWNGLAIGLWQALALIPGMSRSGMTISGGLLVGFSREAAARFGFLMGIPIMIGAGGKKMLELYQSGGMGDFGAPLLFGCLVSFVSALAVIHWLMRYLKNHSLYAFALYRVVLAAVILLSISAF